MGMETAFDAVACFCHFHFSTWSRWDSRHDLDGLEFPGVYVIADPKTNLSGKPCSCRKDIVYIGMTHKAKRTLKRRLSEFNNRGPHAGGRRLLEECGGDLAAKRKRLERFFVAIASLNKQPTEADMVTIDNLEILCLAEYLRTFNCRLPRYNEGPKWEGHIRSGPTIRGQQSKPV